MALERFKARAGYSANSQRSINLGNPLPWQDPTGAQDFLPRDWMLANSNFIKSVARIGNLPNPTDPLNPIRPGTAYLIRQDFGTETLDRLVVWDETLDATGGIKTLTPTITAQQKADVIAVAGTIDTIPLTFTGHTADGSAEITYNADGTISIAVLTPGDGFYVGQQLQDPALAKGIEFTVTELNNSAHGGWAFVNRKNWTKALLADQLKVTDQSEGDLTLTTENLAKEIWTYTNGAWVLMFGEREIRGWIAALSLFEGVVQQVGGTTPNAPDFSTLPDITVTANPALNSHYWVFTGSSNYVVQAGDPIIGSSLAGSTLNTGDWVQVATDFATGNQSYVHVGGNLLTKERGDSLFGLNTWVAGGYEAGTLVNHDGAIYRAQTAVVPGDVAPDAVVTLPIVNPWTKIDLDGGVKWTDSDGNLPNTAPPGELWFVVSSARNSGAGALYYWDAGKTSWEPLTGGGLALAISGGTVIYEKGLVWDEVSAKPVGKYEGDLLYYPVSKHQIDRWDNTAQQWNPVLQDSSTESPTEIFPPDGTITDASYASAEGNGGWLESCIYCANNFVRPYLSFKLATPGATTTAYTLQGNMIANGLYNIGNQPNRGGSLNANTMNYNSSSGWGGLNVGWMDNNNYIKGGEVLFIRTRWHRVSDNPNLSWLWAHTAFSFRRYDNNLSSFNVVTKVTEEATKKIAQISHIPAQGTTPRSISTIKSH